MQTSPQPDHNQFLAAMQKVKEGGRTVQDRAEPTADDLTGKAADKGDDAAGRVHDVNQVRDACDT